MRSINGSLCNLSFLRFCRLLLLLVIGCTTMPAIINARVNDPYVAGLGWRIVVDDDWRITKNDVNHSSFETINTVGSMHVIATLDVVSHKKADENLLNKDEKKTREFDATLENHKGHLVIVENKTKSTIKGYFIVPMSDKRSLKLSCQGSASSKIRVAMSCLGLLSGLHLDH